MSSERKWHWVDQIAYFLVQRAARGAPGALSERLDEEWLADLTAQSGPAARLRFALGCCWATNVIAREHVVQPMPAPTFLIGQGRLMRRADEDAAFFTGRKIAFVLVASLNVAVLFGLQMGIGQVTPALGSSVNLLGTTGVASSTPANHPR